MLQGAVAAPRQGGVQGAVAAPRQGGVQGAVAAPRQGGVQGAVAAPRQGGVQGAVAAPRQGGAQGAVAAPRQGGVQGAVAAPRQGGAQGAVAAPRRGGAQGAAAGQAFAFRTEVTLMAAVPGDQPLVQRQPDTPIRFRINHTNEDDFRRFAADHNIRLQRVDVTEVIRQLDMRIRLLSGTSQGDHFLWAPLLKHVSTGLHRQVIALMTLALHLYGNTELAYLLIFCVSKLSLIRIRQIMKSIWDKTHHY